MPGLPGRPTATSSACSRWRNACARRGIGSHKKAPLLVRLDSGFDSAALMRSLEACNQSGQPQVDWLIKWNPRSTGTAEVLARREAAPATQWQQPRAGKRVVVWEEQVTVQGIARPVRRVLRLGRTATACLGG